MKHYKDENNGVWAYEDSFAGVVRAGLTLIDDAELAAIRAAQLPPAKTSLEIDTDKYLARAASKNLLMAEMAAMNVARIKNGTWTVPQLTALMQDEQIKALIAHMETLSFELAIGVINGLTNSLITPEIKATWTAKLVARL